MHTEGGGVWVGVGGIIFNYPDRSILSDVRFDVD